MKANNERITDILGRYGTIIALFVMIVLFGLWIPDRFLTLTNALTILKQGAILTIMASGLTMVLLMNEFDLWIGYLGSFIGMLTTGLMARQGLPMPAAVCLGILCGAGIGLLNGLIVTYLRISSIVATLAVGSGLIGLNYLYTGGGQISSGIPSSFAVLGRGTTAGMPNLIIVMILFCGLLWVFTNYCNAGRRMYAIGGNETAAWLSGINIRKHKILGFMLCGASAGLAGICLASLLSVGHPEAANSFMLDAFAAAFLGAVTLRRGQFHILGTAIGVIILRVTLNGLIMAGAEYFLQITAGILVGAVALSGRKGSRAG